MRLVLKIKTESSWFVVFLKNEFLSLFGYVWVKRHFPLISSFTGNRQILVRFSNVSLASFTEEKRGVSSAKSLKLLKLDKLLQLPLT